MQKEEPLKDLIRELKAKQYLKGIPKTLYKYRSWADNYHKRLLTNQELYFASASQFNDPFDCNPPFQLDENDISLDKIFITTRRLAKKKYPWMNETELHEIVHQQTKNNYLSDEQYVQKLADDARDDINKSFGIVSFTSEEKNFLMWSHYADSHKGFCVGFDTEKLYQHFGEATLERVHYRKEIPKIPLLTEEAKAIENYLRTLLFMKSDVWSYEKEYRSTKNAFARKTQKFSADCIEEIIFGCMMEHSTKLEVLKLIEQLYPAAYVYEMKLDKTQYRLEKARVR